MYMLSIPTNIDFEMNPCSCYTVITPERQTEK